MNQHTTLVPARLNLGSGKDFRADFFNIDVDSTWFPDAVVDLSTTSTLEDGLELDTSRFGKVALYPGYFEQIIANDVLEHVPNLVGLMTTCLRLLRVDGVFDISVPYDLSFGAWQDPTHVRTFNERSWLYYTDWFWYLGWSEARFVVDSLRFIPSQLGQELQQQGLSTDQITRTPRAIDSMSVRLRKVKLTEADQNTWYHFRESKKQLAQQRGATAISASQALRSDNNAVSQLSPFPGGWKVHQDRHCIWIVSPEGYEHHHAFDELAEALHDAFAELGGSAPIVRHPSEWNGRAPIVLGPNLLPAVANPSLPDGTVLFNLEQVSPESGWMKGEYRSLLSRHPVLDYSHRNLEALVREGISHARLLEVGYSQGLTRIATDVDKDIDILFYGSLNERRRSILKALAERGLSVVHLFGIYGEERDAAIARAKVVLNLHYYESSIFEVVRVSYLLANQTCVVSEGNPSDPDVQRLMGGLELVPYEHLVDRCKALVNDAARRDRLSKRGFEAVRASRQSDLLRMHLFPELLASEVVS